MTQPAIEEPVGGYLRHRDRMIQESVFQDLRNTLIACRWMEGETTHPVFDPASSGPPVVVTTSVDQVLSLVEGYPVTLIDYFPEAEDGATTAGEGGKTQPNTLAIDAGRRGDSTPRELGSRAESVAYRFNLALYATSDAIAMALLNDLVDRYRGRIIRDDSIDLWNYNSEVPVLVSRMDVEGFTYTVNTETIAPHEIHLYFGELTLSDEVD